VSSIDEQMFTVPKTGIYKLEEFKDGKSNLVWQGEIEHEKAEEMMGVSDYKWLDEIIEEIISRASEGRSTNFAKQAIIKEIERIEREARIDELVAVRNHDILGSNNLTEGQLKFDDWLMERLAQLRKDGDE